MKNYIALGILWCMIACEPMKEEVGTRTLPQDKNTPKVSLKVEEIENLLLGKTWEVESYEYFNTDNKGQIDSSFAKTFEFRILPQQGLQAVYHAEVYDVGSSYQIADSEGHKILAMMLQVDSATNFLKEFEILSVDSSHLYLYERLPEAPHIHYVMKARQAQP